MGECLVDFISVQRGKIRWLSGFKKGEKPSPSGSHTEDRDAPAFIPAPGGAPANVAVGLALLGKEAGFIGKVGDDPFGRGLAGVLMVAGVDTKAVSFSTEARTMLAFVTRSEAGERDFVFFRHPSADMLITGGDIPDGYLSGTSFFHFGSISLIDDPARATALSLVDRARGEGALVSFDPNVRLSLWPDEATARREILSVIPRVDILKLSEEEAAFLTGEAHPKAAALSLMAMGPGLVAVSRGRKGSIAVTPRYAVEVDGFAVDVVDTTGAGDAFCAAMLAKIDEAGNSDLSALSDLDLITIFRFANAAGAIAVTRPGAIPALPTEGEVTEFLRKERVKRSPRTFH